jgi:hypothetical protein
MKNNIIRYVFKENYFLNYIAQIKNKKITSLNYKNNVSPKIKHCSYPYIYQIIFLIYIAKKTKPIFLPPLTLF